MTTPYQPPEIGGTLIPERFARHARIDAGSVTLVLTDAMLLSPTASYISP